MTYILDGTFLNESTQFDLVVWEHIPSSLVGKSQHIALADVGYDFSEKGSLYQKLESITSAIIILDTINVGNLTPLLPFLTKKEIVIVNIGVGVVSITNKHSLENNDLTIIGDTFPIYEPLDLHQCKNYLSQKGNKYIRIGQEEVEDMLFEDQQAIYDTAAVPMQQFGYSGQSGLVIAQSSLLHEVTQGLQTLVSNTAKSFDLLMISSYQDDEKETIKNTIAAHDVIVIMHDQKDDAFFSKWVEKYLSGSGKKHVYYKHPAYDELKTFLFGYMHEQASIDSQHIVQYLSSL